MKASCINYSETGSFSSTVLSYLAHDPKLDPFVSHFPSLENFSKLIAEKTQPANRQILTEVLNEQYKAGGINRNDALAVYQNIDLLNQENTFTVTTGHQLNIFTGPLYFIYKIVSTINLARDLKTAYPDKNFVPVYWMATEDHDFAEINHTSVYGKNIAWYLEASGPTGRLSTQTIADAVREYSSSLGISENATLLSSIIETAYLEHDKLADATRHLVNSLFREYGLVIVDADHPSLKRLFAGIIEKDILEQTSYKAINKTSAALEERGFKTQVHAREINFFYMEDGLRERIVFENGEFYILNTALKFSSDELRDQIRKYPEKFSPNVVMRPLYQETILPNLAYIGGGAELVYWLQLRDNFLAYNTIFPILLLRNSALVTHEEFSSKLCRLDICHKDVFKPSELIKKEWVLNHSNHVLNLSDEWKEISSIFEKIKLRTYKIDQTLAPSTEAVKARLHKAMNNLEKKLLKADVRNHGDVLVQIDNFKNKYFPGGGLQERTENFGPFFIKYGTGFISELIRNFKPLDSKFTILEP